MQCARAIFCFFFVLAKACDFNDAAKRGVIKELSLFDFFGIKPFVILPCGQMDERVIWEKSLQNNFARKFGSAGSSSHLCDELKHGFSRTKVGDAKRCIGS